MGFRPVTYCETCKGTGRRERKVGFFATIEVRRCGKCGGSGLRPMTMQEQEDDGQGTLFGRADEVKPKPKVGLPDG